MDKRKISSKTILEFAGRLANETNIDTILVISERKLNKQWLRNIAKKFKVILALLDPKIMKLYKDEKYKTILSPIRRLSRFSKIRYILIAAISRGYIKENNKVICVSGGVKRKKTLDSVTIIDMEKQFQEIAALRRFGISRKIPLAVIESVLDIAIELSAFGRETLPIGTIFIIGDIRRVLKLSKQIIFNPFRGYSDKERNLKNPQIKESVCELAKIDGAFLVRSSGVICSAGRLLFMPKGKVKIVKGLGARHNAAAYITKKTHSIGIVVSESTGFVSVFVRGKLLFRLSTQVSLKKSIWKVRYGAH
jgi:DNA integrity scanning protein DisA with diadenylate cyclase activity